MRDGRVVDVRFGVDELDLSLHNNPILSPSRSQLPWYSPSLQCLITVFSPVSIASLTDGGIRWRNCLELLLQKQSNCVRRRFRWACEGARTTHPEKGF
jgi:hypothetical protein